MDSTSKLFSRLDLTENCRSPCDNKTVAAVCELGQRQRQQSPYPKSLGLADKPSKLNSFKDMDDMDIDLVEEASAPSFNPRTVSRRKKNNYHWRDSGPRNFGNTSTTRNDTEQQRRRARLIQQINSALDNGDSSLAQDKVLESEQNGASNEAINSGGPSEKSLKLPVPVPYHPRYKGSWRKKGNEQLPVYDGGNLVLKSRKERGKREGSVPSSDQFQHDVYQRNHGLRKMTHNGYIVPCNSAKSRIRTEVDNPGVMDLVGGETCSSFTDISNKDRMKGVDSPGVSQPKTSQGHQRWTELASLPKNTGPRRLVQDGPTSHYNIVHGKYAAKDYGVGTMMHDEPLDENSSHHIVSPDSESRHPYKKKGKMILEDKFLSGGHDNKAEKSFDRHCSVAAEGVPATADDDNAFRSSEDIAWRKYDTTSKAAVLPYEESVCASKREEGTSSYLSDQRHKITTEYGDYVNHVDDSPEITNSNMLIPSAVLAPQESEIRRRGNQRGHNFMKGKRECNSICSSYGGSSSSTFENSEASHLSSRHIPHSRLARTHDSQHHGDIFDPVIVLDEPQSPEVRCNNPPGQSTRAADHSSARVSQVESDEILARQLQEQFYDEVAGSAGPEEIDATIAWSLQQEDARLAASNARSGQSDHREASMAHLYAYYAQLPYRNSSARWSDRAQSRTSNRRRNYYRSEIDLETRMMAEVRNFTGMDLGMRRNFLEALEAAFDQSNEMLAAENALENDFNEYDYEMLLALDENNHQQAGASESQINSLPQSVTQSDNVEEACAVCLENPSLGDIIRHLPCLHKFHKECIDPWLRRKTWCPVCKSEIT